MDRRGEARGTQGLGERRGLGSKHRSRSLSHSQLLSGKEKYKYK